MMGLAFATLFYVVIFLEEVLNLFLLLFAGRRNYGFTLCGVYSFVVIACFAKVRFYYIEKFDRKKAVHQSVCTASETVNFSLSVF